MRTGNREKGEDRWFRERISGYMSRKATMPDYLTEEDAKAGFLWDPGRVAEHEDLSQKSRIPIE